MKGGVKLDKFTQEQLDILEKKEFEFEIKSMDETGKFKGIASPFNNIDRGDDRVLPSASKRNEGKVVPFLVQHTMGTDHGEMKMFSTKDGIEVEGQLYLDTLENGNPIFPEAYKSQVLGKRKKLKLSIGYVTHKYSYDTKGVRNLEDIEIFEISRVTIPMNSKAKVTEMKGVEKIEKDNNIEEKAMSFTEILAMRENGRKSHMVMNAFHESIGRLLNDSESTKEQKLLMLDKNLSDFSTAYKETISALINAGTKSDELDLETKEFEAKAGASISKANKAKLNSLVKQIQAILGEEEPDKKENEELEKKDEEFKFEFKSTFTKEG